MLFYLVSLGFLVFVFFSSFGEKTTKAKGLNIAGCIIAVVSAYYVFSEDLTDSFFWNLVLAILPIAGGLVTLLSLATAKSNTSSPPKDTANSKPFFNVDIVDDESSAAPHSATYSSQTSYSPYVQQPQYTPQPPTNPYAQQTPSQPESQPQYEPISYINAKIEGFGSCDVVESAEFIKITMRAEGKEYEFYVKDQNIVAYRAEGMGKPQSY